MSSASPPRQALRGPWNALHDAACHGSMERIMMALVSPGEIDIDLGNPHGATPLMLAATFGHSRVARTLLNKGATVSLINHDGVTALHMSAREGHLAVTKLLVQAGSDLAWAVYETGHTALHFAAEEGHSEVVGLLIEAGANPNSRSLDGSTPLYSAVWDGHVGAIKVLLRANANPLLSATNPYGHSAIALEAAAQSGQSEVVSELVLQLGIDGCGGASGGVRSLASAAQAGHMEILATLLSAGVVDTGRALICAAEYGCEASVRVLLKQHEGNTNSERTYVNTRDDHGTPPLFKAIGFDGCCSVRVVRLLVNAGADTSSTFRITSRQGVTFDDTPWRCTTWLLRQALLYEEDAKGPPSPLLSDRLVSVRRLLMRVEAVHAVSWLWARDVPSITHAATKDTGRAATTTSTSLTSTLPTLRRRARRPRILWVPLFRHSEKP